MKEKSEARHPHETPAAARVAVPRCSLYSTTLYRELDPKGLGWVRPSQSTMSRIADAITIAIAIN